MARKHYLVVMTLLLVVTAGAFYALSDRSHTQTQRRVTPAGVPPAEQSNATFSVTNVSAPARLKLGDTITVDAEVTNTGDEPARETIEFVLAGERYRRRAVTLDPGESRRMHFEQNTMGIGVDPGDYYTGILAGDAGDMTPVTFRKGYDVDEIDAPETVIAGTEFVIRAEVKNYNHFDDTQVLKYRLDGVVLARERLPMESEDEKEIAFEIDTKGIEPGAYVHGITANGSGSHGTIEIRPRD
jgi:hypothetical protein